jgi:tyrosinase
MVRLRQNVFELGDDWADPILWYARGVKAMKARPLADPKGWNFYAAIHGIDRWLWDFYGFTNPGEPAASQKDQATYWNQCQHQSWYFLPWHRGYLLALEAQLRSDIAALGGPTDSWALPYWNYFGAGQNRLPGAFLTPDWPDGKGDNPLYVVQRYGVLSTATPYPIWTQTNLKAMNDPTFTPPAPNVSVGFGGPKTGFSWSGSRSGGIESNPHNMVHVLVGGQSSTETFPPNAPNGFANQPLEGVMADPSAAALDPIFYLHHCNIDRLWQSWNTYPQDKPRSAPTDWADPTDSQWLDGPASIGQRGFAMPTPTGGQWTYVPGQMQDIGTLGYSYDDLTPGAATAPALVVAARGGIRATAALAARAEGGMDQARGEEMMAASPEGLSLRGAQPLRSALRVAPVARDRLLTSFAARETAPDRVFLTLENITGLSNAGAFSVYLGLPEGTKDDATLQAHLVGGVSLFGVRQASDPDGAHGGSGITVTLEVTEIVDRLHLSNALDGQDIDVDILPVGSIPDSAAVRIGRISLHRQPG